MSRIVGAFGPVRFPVYPPSGSEDTVTAEGVLEAPSLAHVHGFHVAARPPALFLKEDQIVVAAGRLVVILDLPSRKQHFINGHTEAVTCLAYSAELNIGASGQVISEGSKCSEVLIWKPDDLQPISSLVFHQADIETIGFLQGGELLVTIGADRDHTLALWSVAKDRTLRVRREEKTPLVTCSAYKSGIIHGVLAAPAKTSRTTEFVTFGAAHVKFWKCERVSSKLDSRRGSFDQISSKLDTRRKASDEGAPRAVVHVAWTPKGQLVAGGSEGQVYFFEGTRAISRIHQHNHSVALLVPLKDTTLVVYAHGRCSLLRDGEGVGGEQLNLATLPGAPDARMQSPIVGGKAWRQSLILLASKTHLMLVDLAGGTKQPQSCTVLMTQASKQVTAVCSHPSEPRFYAGSLDGCVRCFRSDTQEALPERSFKATSGVSCLALSDSAPGSSAWLAIGCEDSSLTILGEGSLNYAFMRSLTGQSERKRRLTCARFSPCDCSGNHPLWLAVGADDGSIHTFRFKEPACTFESHTGAETVTKVATLKGHAGAVMEISFASTLPCTHLVSVDSFGQALAFDIKDGRRLSSMALVRDVPFTPWTLPIGWHVLGCWAPQRVASNSSSSPALPKRCFSAIPGRSLLAATNAESPAVELYPFPCPTPPRQSIPRLDGPASLISSLVHCRRSGHLIAASDAVIFIWAWSARPAWEAAPNNEILAKSPLRPCQGMSAVFETPEGRKHAVASGDIALLETPQKRTPAPSKTKENTPPDLALKSPSDRSDFFQPMPRDRRARSSPATPSPVQAREGCGALSTPLSHVVGPTDHVEPQELPDVVPLPGELEEHPVAANVTTSPSRADSHQVGRRSCPTPETRSVGVFYLGGAPGEIDLSRRHARQDVLSNSRDFVSPKIGTTDGGVFGQVARQTQQVREDTEARARSVHDRLQCDTVGLLINGSQRRSSSAGAIAERSHRQQCSEGRFVYRARDVGTHFEVEAELRGGRLVRVMRNPLRRTLTFEGEVANDMQEHHKPPLSQERLVVRIPPGFDLMGPPAHVDRFFAEGRCLVALHRGSAYKESKTLFDFRVGGEL
mmetsp:Transcript_69213/g.108315  ORF Transcript_69213/g.108315 Transcript_69213/m.108315 type:complete len:1077 (+) Transcript_69213:30-3260(+)|eukprot:CAMPEP_0169097506 /NCGR_PEP_ID=MMETSP1015-20121227/19556_1 /TAXON_ID=342587 /ORGANISM="Karlodinium micrum, Strain CCMP2283" /LENGTH=1076 /DNA_ID=CAMNT_0009158317 /DNA_START=32 /DNA_END=3262 /DNA_ORIENTATION=+